MFFHQRATQAEFFDRPGRSLAEVTDDYRQLARANRLFHFAHPFEMSLPRLLGRERCRSLTVLDLGGGDGSLGRELTTWADRQGWEWRCTTLDLNPLALGLNPGGRNVAGSVLALPFADNSFDVVLASQMTHHLPDDPAIAAHFREAWRVSRDVVLLSDLHRNVGLYALVWLAAPFLGLSRELRADGLLSVKRAFRLGEWQARAAQAGIPAARVWNYFGSRIMLEARKSLPAPP